MILYKYLSFDAAATLLATRKVQFSRCDWFNDPFDHPTYPGHGSSDVLGTLHLMAKEQAWRRHTGLLCLTRTARNPLMWAHYAERHTGIVVGIDAAKAGLTESASNLIPAQFGSVAYVSERPRWEFLTKPATGLLVGGTHAFPGDHFEKLQRLFLTKPLQWAYEEEVRIAKCARDDLKPGEHTTPSGDWIVVADGDKRRHLYQLPPGSIVEVHFGIRSEIDQADTLRAAHEKAHPEIRWLESTLGLDQFNVLPTPHTTVAEALKP